MKSITKRTLEFAAIDPLALIFPPDIYARIIVDWKYPHVPRAEELERVVRTVPLEEREVALARARTMKVYAEAAEEALAKMA